MVLKADVSPPRHQWWYRPVLVLGRIFVFPFVTRKYNIRTERFKGKVPDPSILMFNHVSDFDFMGTLNGFPKYARYVASDALISTRRLRYLMALTSDFIFRRKGQNADNVVESVKASIARGVHVCIAPEGGLSINGTTAHIRARTGQMVKDAGAGMVTFRMEGGYFIRPSWASHRFDGPMFGRVVGVYTKEQMAAMDASEINELIYRDLYVNSYEWQREHMVVYKGKDRAEHMEMVLYLCPKCLKVGGLHSEGDTFCCRECGYSLSVDQYGFFQGDDPVFDNLYDWDVWQREYFASRVDEFKADPERIIFQDRDQVYKGIKDNYPYVIEDDVTLSISVARITIRGKLTDIVIPMEKVGGVSVVSRTDLVIICDDEYYRVGTNVHRSAVKYKQIVAMLRGKPYL